MIRRFCIIRKYVSSMDRHSTFVHFNDIEKPYDTFGMYGFDSFSDEVVKLPFTKLELINKLSPRVFYNKCEFGYNKHGELISIKCGDYFLGIKKKDNPISCYSQREINKLMKDNF